MIGKTLSHYRIVERIGGGGMGEVHRARDERLGRDVAVKVLPAGSLDDPAARERFRREALTLSKLNHPHIATLYDLDRQDGVDFLVMEYIAGRTLAERVAEAPIAEREAGDIACQIAEALEEAHEQGIVHGDLSSRNVIVTPKGWVKILDFGLATLCGTQLQGAETAAYTGENVVAGTLPYMAPEQLLQGEGDTRSDLYALGVVLYEMTTGRQPFREALASAQIEAIIHRAPDPPSTVSAGRSALLDRIVLRLLQKAPERRYQTVKDLKTDLCRLGYDRTPAEPEKPRIDSIAVLPLENLSGDPEQDYFADGMTEALIAGLARIGSLRVISRTSVMRYKGARAALPEIARALDVSAIVEGSVVRSGNRVRITALLVDAASDRHLWAETYERDLGDILALQSEVARAIARRIEAAITPQEEARLARKAPVDPDAFQAYLKGRYHWEKRSAESLQKARQFFQEAIERDPGYAPAYAGLADYYITLGNFNLADSNDVYPKAKAAALRGLEFDPGSAEAYTSLATVKGSYEWDREGAERDYRHAIALNPNYANAHHWFADHLVSLGRFEEGNAEIEKARALDPLSIVMGADAAGYLFYEGRHEEALEKIRKTLELDPNFAPTYRQLGGIYEQMGRFDEAIEAFRRSGELSGSATYYSTALAHTYAMAGRRDDALRMLAELDEIARTRYVSLYALSAVHVALGDHERALELLDRAVKARDRALIWLKVAPRFNALRSDPRFQKISKIVGAA